jgi:hypothetical protein
MDNLAQGMPKLQQLFVDLEVVAGLGVNIRKTIVVLGRRVLHQVLVGFHKVLLRF